MELIRSFPIRPDPIIAMQNLSGSDILESGDGHCMGTGKLVA